ncbi:MAG: MoxR family ATPase [Planctomycetota bacterium]
MDLDVKRITEQVEKESVFIHKIREQMSKVIIGQSYLCDRLIIALLTGGHVLLEGVPGLAKTLTISTLAQVLKMDFKRIQFTPDLLPADILGTLIYNPKTGEFTPKKGPIFANMILADEINRAPAKVQSALLESMQEKQVTIGGERYSLPSPFIVLATQNPIDQEGTYALPEAQVDRFMLKLLVQYPTKKEEREILERHSKTTLQFSVTAVVSPEEILKAREVVDQIYMDDKLKDYIVDIVYATRQPKLFNLKELEGLIDFGASTRATINLTLASKAYAFIAGRGFVLPQDIKDLAPDIFRHRLILSYEAEAEEWTPDRVLQKILDTVPVP